MEFRRYQHIERFGNDEVDGIELGTCYVFSKIDGTNSSVWLGNNREICAGSRNRQLSLENDNAGFFATIKDRQNILDYLSTHPTHRLFGEFLVPHTLKTYRDDAWRKFYIFDVCVDSDGGGLEYLPYEVYQPMLEEFKLEYLAPLAIIKNGNYDSFSHCLDKNIFLIKEGMGAGEGVVIKNYDFYNKYGRQTWAKIVTNEFKEKHHKAMGPPVHENKMIESSIALDFVTRSFVEKEHAKIVLEQGGWNSKLIPMLLGRVFYELINEEMWHILKQYKNPTINFKTLNNFVIGAVKSVMPEIFG